jgi:CheY-like chemotaxis protein
MTLDRELLDAFVPEFVVAAMRLGAAGDAAQASRALDQLRSMATALGAPSLIALAGQAAAAMDPFDAAAIGTIAEAAADQARAIAAAGADVPLPAVAAPPPPTPPPPPPPAPRPAAPDRELLDAFLPEFDVACLALANAGSAAAAAKQVATLRSMADGVGLDSLIRLLASTAKPLEAGDLVTLAVIARAARAQAARIRDHGGDLDLPGAAAARKRVLVVDDSPMMRRLVREIVAGDPDLDVVGEAADGVAALAAMRSLHPDLTLLDIEMPELDGIGVLRGWALRGSGAVVVVSSAAPAGSPTATEVRRLGAADIVAKPSGALSPDLRERQGETLRRAARRAAGLHERAPA